MGKIGTNELPAQMQQLYGTTEHECLILTDKIGAGAGNSAGQPYWTAYIGMLGYVDLTDGRQSNQRGMAQWVLTDAEEKERAFYRSFAPLTVYRVKALLPMQTGDRQKDHPARMAGIYVREILAEGETNAFLQKLLDDYNTVQKMHSELLGDLILNKDRGYYTCDVQWCGVKADISLEADDPDADLANGLRLLEAFVRAQEKWDALLRKFAAEELTELANEWAADEFEGEDDEEPPEITEEEFARRLTIEGIQFEPDGSFTVYFGDDDMFWGHCVTVYGDVENGPEDAQMEG